MTEPRRLEGTGEIFAGDKSYGLADWSMLVTTTPRGKSADGTLEFHEPISPGFQAFDLTVQPEHGDQFKLTVRRIANGRVSVASNGPMPGL